jgi:phosphoglycolate phosphatase
VRRDPALSPASPSSSRSCAGAAIAWGIVTNKATRFTERIVAELKLDPDCVACGDTTPHLKPHPAFAFSCSETTQPAAWVVLLFGRRPARYEAAHAAGMRPIAGRVGLPSS